VAPRAEGRRVGGGNRRSARTPRDEPTRDRGRRLRRRHPPRDRGGDPRGDTEAGPRVFGCDEAGTRGAAARGPTPSACPHVRGGPRRDDGGRNPLGPPGPDRRGAGDDEVLPRVLDLAPQRREGGTALPLPVPGGTRLEPTAPDR